SEERLQYAEGWYDEHQRSTDAEDITLDGWVVQRRCPHLKADLSRFGLIDNGTLTCQLHGWSFDLASRRCLTSAGHPLPARPADGPGRGRPAVPPRPRRSWSDPVPQTRLHIVGAPLLRPRHGRRRAGRYVASDYAAPARAVVLGQQRGVVLPEHRLVRSAVAG